MNIFASNFISCKPISNLKDLITWSPGSSPKYKTGKLNESYFLNNVKSPKFLVCHDMKNNYLEDKYIQGSNSSTSYSFYHWNLIDTFIYFSHHLVTVPPESWINAAHENNCRILGTFITEFDQGFKICEEMFDKIDLVIEKLVEITLHFNFDGWLINIENKIENMEKLNYFVNKLTQKLKNENQNRYQIIWYDSVIDSGDLIWQNELNNKNKQFFECTDGIFVNYTWKEENLNKSLINSGDRCREVYVGIDVFGRGCLGDGGFNSCLAFNEIYKKGLSYALFAPGWIHECNDEKKFYENSDKFWSLLQPYVTRRKVKHLPIVTSFSHSSSDKIFIKGQMFNDKWNNLNLQSLIPIVENSTWDFDDGFYGSNSLVLSPGENILFNLDIKINNSQILVFEYIYKINGNIDIKLGIEDSVLNLDKNNDKIIILDTLEKTINDWNYKRIVFKFHNEIKLNSIIVKNDNHIKLGLIRFFDKNEEKPELEISIPRSFSFENNVFRLNNNIYLMVKINLDFDEIKYYNIFLNKCLDYKDNSELKYIGSSKREYFLMCLKLNENVFVDSSEESSNKNLEFEINYQEIDHNFDNLVADRVNLGSSMNICIPKVKLKNEKDFTFLSEIIYDMEFF